MKLPLDIPPGLVADETTHAAPGRWETGSNIRFWLDKPQVRGGYTSAFSTALTGICRNALAWTNSSSAQIITFGTHSKLQVYESGTVYDITPAALGTGATDSAAGPGYGVGGFGSGTYGVGSLADLYARTWSLAQWGDSLIANPRGGNIYVWDGNTADLATTIPNAPTQVNCIVALVEKRLVLALGCNEEVSGVFNPMCIRNCNINDYTDWTTNNNDNVGEDILTGGGRIVGAKTLGPYVLVWTDVGLYSGQFIGSSEEAFRWDPVAFNCGLIGPNAVTIINQVAYWVTPDLQFYRWQPGSPPEMVLCPIHDEFLQNCLGSQGDKIVAVPNTKFDEVEFFYPDMRDGTENSRSYVVSTIVHPKLGFIWSKSSFARTAAIDSGPTAYPLAVTSDGMAYWHENGNTANGGVLTWSLTSTDMYLGQAERFVLCRGIWPDFEAQVGPISLTFSLRQYPQAVAATKGPYTLATGAGKVDFMATGRIGQIVLAGSSAPAYMRLGSCLLDVVPTGAN